MENADDVRKFRDITGYAINKYISISSFSGDVWPSIAGWLSRASCSETPERSRTDS